MALLCWSSRFVWRWHAQVLMATSLAAILVLSLVSSSNADNVGTFDLVGLIADLPTKQFYINGTWVEPAPPSSETFKRFINVVDPSTAETAAKVAIAGPEDVDAAVKAAKEAWLEWSYHTPLNERKRYVQKLARIYASKIEEMAQLISTEMGSPIEAARESHAWGGLSNIESSLELIDEFEFEKPLGDDELTTILYESIGVVGMITPWNWPLNQITLKVVPALLVGCTCVLKPSEESPLSALLFAEMVHQAGFPPGVFNLVNGDGPFTGDSLTKHPDLDMISFTGSTRAGRQVAVNAALGPIKTTLELGGKGANIFFADVGDEWMEEVVVNGVESVFYNSGQTCNAPTRMLVQQPFYNMAVELATNIAKTNSPVDSAHEDGDEHIGPVVSRNQFERIQEYIQIGIDEGARLVAGGLGRPEHLANHPSKKNGYYVRPTVFADCKPSMTIMQEEIFGPVLCIVPFTTEDEALQLANDTPYGLTNYVHSRNFNRRRRMGRLLRSGMVEMNDAAGDHGSPFGGVKGSGYGREGGIFGFEEFCIIKALTGFIPGEDDLFFDQELETSAGTEEAEL
ncbi:unnamed protein product [Pseudo-nitzschia multistriata]|uniref:aldehyde dehydrogenase (NAD(+)) n=1 Tax=Pseudo-nitzschia multistriata TaxID=183589 RepID=A0A448ZSJ2_9STRA|nr:unnamed protein product [Pseudo-nitzschia multistriata]